MAGNGTYGYSGDGGPATNAKLSNPRDVVVDKHGNVYFSDMSTSTIRKIDTNGIISAVAGIGSPGFSGDGGAATDAQLLSPIGIGIDKIGNLYICDHANARLRKVDIFGIITTIAGNGIFGYNGDSIAATAAQLNGAYGVAVDTGGNIYIADCYNHRIRKINTTGIITTIAGIGTAGFSGDNGPATNAQLSPVGIIIHNNYIYISDSNRVRKIDNTTGIITTIAGTGIGGYSGDGGLATAATFGPIEGLAVDDTGNIYVSDVENYTIRKINTTGIINTIAGSNIPGYSGDGGNPVLAKLNSATGVAINGSGKIYIADQQNSRVRCIGCTKSVGIADVEDKHIASLIITPNPSIGNKIKLILRQLQNERVAFSVINAAGITIMHTNARSNEEVEMTIDLPSGVYIVQAKTPQSVLSQQFIKK